MDHFKVAIVTDIRMRLKFKVARTPQFAVLLQERRKPVYPQIRQTELARAHSKLHAPKKHES